MPRHWIRSAPVYVRPWSVSGWEDLSRLDVGLWPWQESVAVHYLALSWVSLPTCVILEFQYFPQERFQLAFDVTSEIFTEDTPTLLYSECCMYSESKCKLYLSKSVHLLLSIRAALEIHTALYCHHEEAKCQFRVRSWWALYMRRLFPPVMSLPMFIIPQYPAITLDGWSLAIINLQCWVLLHQLVNIPGKENIMYQSILNWTSQFARKKCSYYSMVAVVNYN